MMSYYGRRAAAAKTVTIPRSAMGTTVIGTVDGLGYFSCSACGLSGREGPHVEMRGTGMTATPEICDGCGTRFVIGEAR